MELLTSPPAQSAILAFACWVWFFILAPDRSFKTGIKVEAIPVVFKMNGFKIFRAAALLGLCYLGYAMPIQPSASALLNQMFLKNIWGPPAAIGTILLFLFLIPMFMASRRRANDEHPGGWETPALTLFGWLWLGLALLLSFGVPQYYVPALTSMFGHEGTLDESSGLTFAVCGIVFYLVYWGLPGANVAKRADRGDSRASAELPHIRWVGLPAWVIFLFEGGSTRAPKPRKKGDVDDAERKLCPSCMRPIDELEDYGSLDFDHCPHCKELIPAAFNLREYTEYCAEMAVQMRGEGKTKGNPRGKKALRQAKASEEVVQRLERALLTLGVRERATDMHFVNDGGQLVIRYRIDGVLQTLFNFPASLARLIISAIKVQSNMDISETRKPQDGSFKTSVDGVRLDLRVNTSPTSDGETASLRLIYRHRCLGSLDNLGLNRRAKGILEKAIYNPHGLILVTGPTGSGKSTTLYNALAAISDGQRNIITLEDPIEFKLEGITQMQVEPVKNFTFVTGLRSILRQDPDVIMVGEVRDGETAKMAVDASMTGHLVFTTLHTIDTTTAIGRLQDLGVDAHQHAEALQMIIAQRLVRLICNHCSEEYKVTREELEAMSLPGGPAKLLLRRGRGCPHCYDTGYYDREGIYEVLTASHPIKALISNRAAPYEIREEARRNGMRTLLEDGLVKVILGRTAVEELLRVVS